MRIGTCLLFLFAGPLVIGNVQLAFGNGRTVPQPMGASPLKASCIQIDGGQLEIFRARLINGDDFDETLEVTSGGVTEDLSLREIKLLRFLTTEINADGLMKAKIVRTGGTEETSSMVQVRSGGTAIRLTGFKSNGTKLSIDLSSCQAVELSSLQEGEPNSSYRPVTAD
jgi:hypothetical protein